MRTGKYTAILVCLGVAVLAIRCKTQSPQNTVTKNFPKFYQEGHRGTRGLMPENTIAAMCKALEVGANVLELDVHISRDKQVIVTHDPYINPDFSLLPNGQEIPKEDGRKYLVYQMDYAQIRKFDVGLKPYPAYPQQKKMASYIPLLGELIDSVDAFARKNKLAKPIYNIEIKANTQKDGEYQPAPAELVKLVMGVVKQKKIEGRYYVQSFDVRPLQEIHKNYPEVVIGFLTGSKSTFDQNMSHLGFLPTIYSPAYQLATPELVKQCHQKGITFIPWTVNTLAEMKAMKAMQVDGIITDYPNLFAQL